MAFNLKNILISDEVAQKCVDILKRNGIEATKNTKLSKEELLAEIPKYDGLIVRSATKVTAEVIEAGRKLKIIGRAGTGVDNIDIPTATKHGIIVMNTPGGNTLSAAEHTCTLLLAMSRHVSRGTSSLQEGRWDTKRLMGNEVYGKTLGIVGLGRIGKEVALRMQSFGMTTIGYDPIIPASESAEFGVEWMELKDLWPKVDYITVHTPLIKQTKNLINDETFAQCRRGVRVINCARGGIIDEEALLRNLESGQCGGAGLDVFLNEPPTSLDLIKHPLVTSTPHLGASTVEAQARVAEEIAEQFVDLVQGKSLFGALNAPAVTEALSESSRPWIELGSALGQLVSGMGTQVTAQSQVQVTTKGASLQKAGSFLQAAALVGLLRKQSSNGLNLISAPALAKDMGITTGSRHDGAVLNGAPVTVQLTVSQGGEVVVSVTGTVSGGLPQLVALNNTGLSLAVGLTGDVLIYSSQTSPQTFPAITAALAASDVSVLSYSSTKPVNGVAWNILQISPSLSNIESLKSHTQAAYQINF